MAIAIFGGSFDPPHAGHVAVAEAAIKALPIETLYVVPAYINPFKSGTHAPPELRRRWLERIFGKQEGIVVSDYEIRQGRPVPTIETVRHFRSVTPEIFLIVGADNLAALEKWHDFDTLDSLVTWVVATRGDDEAFGRKFRRLDIDVDISSTQLRALEKTHLIPDAVRTEIENYYKDIMCKNV